MTAFEIGDIVRWTGENETFTGTVTAVFDPVPGMPDVIEVEPIEPYDPENDEEPYQPPITLAVEEVTLVKAAK